jgi:hypothetical protein
MNHNEKFHTKYPFHENNIDKVKRLSVDNKNTG